MVRVAELDGQPYLARINCEYFDALRDVCHANGSRLVGSFRSEREDWILTMVAAGMGVCFLPEFSNTIPGVISRPVVEPSVAREVSPGDRGRPPLVLAARGVRACGEAVSLAGADRRRRHRKRVRPAQPIAVLAEYRKGRMATFAIPRYVEFLSRITLFDEAASTAFDGLPASASRLL